MPRDSAATSEHRTFLAIAGLIATMRGGVTALDLGGALGSAYVYLIDSLPADRRVAYHVVDLEPACEEGRRLHAADPQITFHATLPSVRDLDVVYVNGALQYVADYVGTMRELAASRASVILFTELPAGDFPTFATAQMNIDGRVGTWFFNRDELVVLMTDRDYVLVLDGRTAVPNDQSNLPARRRVTNYHTLLFCHRTWIDRIASVIRAVRQ